MRDLLTQCGEKEPCANFTWQGLIISWLFFSRVCRNFVNSYQGPWLETQLGVPQGSLLSLLICLVYTSDLTLQEEKPQSQVKLSKPQESKYADDTEFWRTHKNYNQLLINIQLAIVNLQSWFYKWCISLNISKTNYMVFYNKKKKPSPPSIPVTINEIPLKQVQTKRVLGIVIDENLTFTSHIENITIKCKQAYNRLTLFPDLNPNLAVQLYKSYIHSKLEYGCIVWGHSIYKKNHVAMLESAQKGALSLILCTLKSTPTDALESELFIPPIDLRIQELQHHEAIKLFQKENPYISNKINKSNQTSFNTPFALSL